MELNMEQRVRWLVLLATVTVVPIHPQQPQSPSPNNPQTAGAVRQMAPAADANLQGGRSPAARYSPLAAGGYRGQHISWYDALLHSLNPRNVDWGMSWEKRRAIFLENTAGNRYFVFCAVVLLCLYAALVAMGWIVRDHKKDIRYFETELVKGRNWASYWRNRALEAIGKHNEHIEKCNRVVEAGENGILRGDSEAADFRRELERTRTDLLNVTSEKLRLETELDEKRRLTTELSFRVDEVTRRIGNGSQDNGPGSAQQTDDKAALVARINRLETALAAATRENRRLKGA
jgi:hypothetical protein